MGVPAPSLLLGLTGLHIDGGIASVSRCVARAVDEAVRAGRVARADRVLLLEDPDSPCAPPQVGVQRFARGSQARFALELWWQRSRRRHDLVFFDLVGLARALRVPALRLGHPRSAIFVHGTELAAAREGSRAAALRAASLVLTNSRTTAAQVAEAFPELAARIRPVPLCIDPKRVALWEASHRERLPAGTRRLAALIVGRMWSDERGKGHDALIEAWPRVLRRCPEAELWIAGGGDDVVRLEEKTRQLGIAQQVRFLGRVGDDELGRRYQEASLYAMPSRQEGFGLAWAEALWHGTPCIGSTLDAAGEVIRDGETGLLVPYGDREAVAAAVIELFTDPERRKRMGEVARADARQRFGYARFRSDLLTALDL